MLLATTALPDSPTPLPNDQPPDPLTAIVSGTAGTWHPGSAFYCLWQWARRRWPHTREWTATWRVHLDGGQQLEAIPPAQADGRDPRCDQPVPRLRDPPDPGAGAGLAIAARHPHLDGGPGGTRIPCARNPKCPPQRPGAARGKPPRALNHREAKAGTHYHEHAGQHRQDRPSPSDPAHACRAHRSQSPAVQRRRTAAHARRESRTGHPKVRRRYSSPGITCSRQRIRQGASNQRLQNRPSTATTPGEPTLPKRTPSYNPTTRDRATDSTNACRSGTLAGKASTCPAHATDTQQIWATRSDP